MKKSFAYPYGVWLAVFILAPILMVVVYAFHNADGGFTLHNFSYLPGFLPIFGRSFWLAFLSTAVCLVLGYPMAYLMSRLSASRQSLCMMLIMLPMWINFLLRTYAWMSILENNGFINQFFRSIGLISFLQSHFGYSLDYIPLINTQGAIVLGMVYNFLPFMVLPIYTVVISQMLGSGKNLLVGDLIDLQFMGGAYNPHLGSAIALVMIILIFICMWIMNKFDDGSSEEGGLLL